MRMLYGNTYGHWKVIDYAGDRYWKCICTACNKTIKNVHESSLLQGTSKSCGCMHTNNKHTKDITGQRFNNWVVIKYSGNNKWLCECQCENKTQKIIDRSNLTSGKSKSCGCLRRQLAKNTLLERYGEISPTKVNDIREQWQIDTIENPEKLREYIIESFDKKPTFRQLADKLSVSRHRISYKIHSYNMEELVEIDPLFSFEEKELLELVKQNTKCEVIENVKNIIHPYELDIYIPEKKLAIEFNGNYWHSDYNVDKKYHQNKTLACAKQNIRLIHVFEYEWVNNRDTIAKFIHNLLNDKKHIINARNTIITEVSREVADKFIMENHLQGKCTTDINIALFHNDEIVSIMTFGTPRFNSEYQYEIIRSCSKLDTIINGGTERIFKYFVTKYKPESIITYVDITKFTGNAYLKLGFKATQNAITAPNYKWVHGNKVLSRYQTQKSTLVKNGFGSENDTESDIMYNMGYYRVYDSGNLRLEWKC